MVTTIPSPRHTSPHLRKPIRLGSKQFVEGSSPLKVPTHPSQSLKNMGRRMGEGGGKFSVESPLKVRFSSAFNPIPPATLQTTIVLGRVGSESGRGGEGGAEVGSGMSNSARGCVCHQVGDLDQVVICHGQVCAVICHGQVVLPLAPHVCAYRISRALPEANDSIAFCDLARVPFQCFTNSLG